MEKSENKSVTTLDENQELTCKHCGRPLVQEQSIGFGQMKKNKPCNCSPFNKSCSGRMGWGN